MYQPKGNAEGCRCDICLNESGGASAYIHIKTFILLHSLLQWSAAAERTGIEGLYLAVRGDVEQYHEPKIWFSSIAEKFAKDVLDLDPKCLALKLESYVVAGLDKGK
jgi:hypothetical protein